jgi:hypothetical protein
MAYNIVKLENGNIALYDSTTTDFIKALSPDYVEIECNVNGVVKLIQDNGNVEYFVPADVDNTQILPAAAIPFTGSCADLAELLATDFFFEVSGGGVTQYSPANAAAQYQSLLQCHTFTVATIAAGVNFLRGYYITPENDVNFSELITSISAGVAGNSIFGIYSVKDDGYPDELLYNTTVFNNLTTGGQINIQSGTLKAGTYFVAQSSSSAATFRAFAAQFYLNTANYFGQTDGASLHTGISVNYVYDGTLPAVFPAGGTKTTASLPYLLFKIV